MIWRILRLIDRLARVRLRFLQWLELYRTGGGVHYPKSTSFAARVYFRGSRGKIEVGEGVEFGHAATKPGESLVVQARAKDSQILIGSDCHFSAGVSLVANRSIEIGDGLLCGAHVTIVDCDFHPVLPEERRTGCGAIAPVKIGSNVWLGDGVKVLKGVAIGDGAVVAAGAIVVDDVPPRAIAAGIPARIVKRM